jgi:hypothetical protein
VRAIIRFLVRPWAGSREARVELAKTQAEKPRVRRLAHDLHTIDQENHISARVHRAMRGGHG